MDIFSTLIGFLAGAFTGAAGTYLADKYTDKRREKQRIKERINRWQDIERRFPKVIGEMRDDFSSEEYRHFRAFFVMNSRHVIGGVSEPSFAYYTDKHVDLQAAVDYLQQNGFVVPLSYGGKAKHYRMHERLVDALLGQPQ